MSASNGQQKKTRTRRRAVAEMYLNGYCASEIHDLIGEQFGVVAGTIRNDIVAIRKVWKDDVDHQDEFKGKERYLAALKQLRRKALSGWEEDHPTVGGVIKRVHGRDHKLAHAIDKEMALLSGVHLASNDRTVHLSIEEARNFMGNVMEIVMKHVDDPEIQNAIIKDLEGMDE